MNPNPSDVFKFVSVRAVQRATEESTERGIIRDLRVRSAEELERLIAFARSVSSREAALRRWEGLQLDPLEPWATMQRNLVRYYQLLDPERPASVDSSPLDEPRPQRAGDDSAWEQASAEAWDALYVAHATGADAGARMELPIAALRLLHYSASGGDPEDAEASLALLTARPAISPQLDAVLRPVGEVPAPPRDAPAAKPPSEAPGTVRAKQLVSELERSRQLLDAVSAPIAIAPATLEAEEAEEVGTWSRQRLAVKTTPALQALLGPELTAAQAALLDRLGISQKTPLTVAAQMLQKHVATLSDQALALAGDPDFELGLAQAHKLPFIPVIVPLGPPAPGSAYDADVHGRIKPLGIGDLKVVKQELLAYEPGEVAYIENVLKGESRDRVYRTLDRTETTVIRAEEEVRETERDTQATDRFELKRETDQTIKEDMSVKAGLSVTASYGPIVATATGDFAYATAKEQGEKTAANFAREVVDRSVSKLQTKVSSQRTTNTINEVEETNAHGFNNRKGEEHVVGIYRWVDKRYRAQVYNYGVRMMLEFVVPEPAAFYRAASSKKKVEVDATPPAAFLNDLTPWLPKRAAKRLAARDIDEVTYERYAARYGAAGINPPPPLHRSISVALSKDSVENGKSIAMTSKDLVVPGGYTLSSYEFALSILWIYHPKFTVQVGGDLYEVMNDPSGGNSQLRTKKTGPASGTLDGSIPVSIAAYDMHAFSLNVEAVCTRTAEAYKEWQLQTYDKIAAAYQALQTAYDQKVAQASAVEAGAIQGHNPALNRAIVQTELKKLCITMMTGQHFSQFHAVTDPTNPPQRIPEIEVEEALREGPIVQFLEQAFEWEQMTYLFYPYFWASKSKWVNTTTTVEDPDPSFEQFLTAGSCRVVVPVPIAYADAVTYLLQSPTTDLARKVWKGGEPPTLESDLYESLADEIRGQTDDLGAAKPEGKPWEFTLPTTLVWLQPDSTLPVFH